MELTNLSLLWHSFLNSLALSTGRLGVSKRLDSLLSAAHLSNWATRHNIAASGTSDIRFKLYERSIAFFFSASWAWRNIVFFGFIFFSGFQKKDLVLRNIFLHCRRQCIGALRVSRAHEFMVHASDGGWKTQGSENIDEIGAASVWHHETTRYPERWFWELNNTFIAWTFLQPLCSEEV